MPEAFYRFEVVTHHDNRPGPQDEMLHINGRSIAYNRWTSWYDDDYGPNSISDGSGSDYIEKKLVEVTFERPFDYGSRDSYIYDHNPIYATYSSSRWGLGFLPADFEVPLDLRGPNYRVVSDGETASIDWTYILDRTADSASSDITDAVLSVIEPNGALATAKQYYDLAIRADSVRQTLTDFSDGAVQLLRSGVGGMSRQEADDFNQRADAFLRDTHQRFVEEFANQTGVPTHIDPGLGGTNPSALSIASSTAVRNGAVDFFHVNDGLVMEVGKEFVAFSDRVQSVYGTSGNDVVVNMGYGDDAFSRLYRDSSLLGSGDDIYLGSSVWESIQGGAGNDRVYGGGGNDFFYGEGGSDYYDGGAGFDNAILGGLNGGGFDLFQFDGAVYALDLVNRSFDTMIEVEQFQGGYRLIEIAQVENFDPASYAATYNDLAQAFRLDAGAILSHYVFDGFYEGRQSAGFDVLQYLDNYADLRAAFGGDTASATRHFVLNGVDEHRLPESPLDYIASYADLTRGFGGQSQADLEAGGLWHYQNFGFNEGRRTGIDFDAAQYLDNYADLRAAFGTNEDAAAAHFINDGFAEHRLADDPLAYLASNDDLIATFGNQDRAGIVASSVEHYQGYGFSEGRSADHFSVDTYLANYFDLRAAFVTAQGTYDEDAATLHYIHNGYFEGRTDDLLLV